MTRKVSLAEMTEACGDEARARKIAADIYARDNPDRPLPPTDRLITMPSALASATLTLGLMALDEEASRAFVASIIKKHPTEAALWMAMQ